MLNKISLFYLTIRQSHICVCMRNFAIFLSIFFTLNKISCEIFFGLPLPYLLLTYSSLDLFRTFFVKMINNRQTSLHTRIYPAKYFSVYPHPICYLHTIYWIYLMTQNNALSFTIHPDKVSHVDCP
jgi:predicted histidine transporter YuiF (NhaC family)